MFKWGKSFVVFSLLILPATASAYYLDTPHNESNGMYCNACHSTPGFYSCTESTVDDACMNQVCLSCHSAEGTNLYKGSAPEKPLHSALVMSPDNRMDGWTTKCIDCHDPHFQAQLDWNETDSTNLYLVTGKVHFLPPYFVYDGNDGPYGSTTITIETFTAQPGWEIPATWSTKGDSKDTVTASDGSRGLVFVVDRLSPKETFEVISADATSIKVKGEITSLPPGISFALIYGQTIRSYMSDEESHGNGARDIRFYEPDSTAGGRGGFVDDTGDATPTGLCQVCHTRTNHWRTDGTLADHFQGRQCTNCHDMLEGFVPSADHSTILLDANHESGNTCQGCHGYVGRPEDIHAANGCRSCHTDSPPELNTTVTARIGTNPHPFECTICHENYDLSVNHPPEIDHTVAPANLSKTTLCINCHIGTDLIQDIHGNDCSLCHVTVTQPVQLQSGVIADSDCRGCHTAYFSGHSHDHTSTVTTQTLCASCHIAPASAGPYTAAGEPHAASSCDTCHDLSSATPTGALKGSATNSPTGGNCSACHIGYFEGHSHDHSAGGTNSVATASLCINCHSGDVIAATADASGPGTHQGDCWNCHSTSTGDRIVGVNGWGDATINGGNGGTCNDCHAAYFTGHTHDHSATVTDTFECVNCHTANDPIGIHQNDCWNCHDTATGARIVGASGYGDATVNGGHGGSCADCHSAYFGGHTHHSQTANASQVAVNTATAPTTSNCIGCHTAITTPFVGTGEVHNPQGCATCHNAANGTLNPPAIIGGGECADCHITHFDNHSHVHDVVYDPTVDKSQDSGISCAICHIPVNGLTSWSGIVNEHNGTCSTCHDYADNGNRTGDPDTPLLSTVLNVIDSGAGVTCVTCHTKKDTNAGIDPNHGSHEVTDFAYDSNCIDCHDDGGLGVVEGVHGNICTLCHSTAYGGDGTAKVGDDGDGDATLGDTTSPHLTTCTGCHYVVDADVTAASIGGIHHDTPPAADGNCVICHVISGHEGTHNVTIGDNTYCTDCHGANPAGLASGTAPIDPTDEFVHDSCTTCHAFAAAPALNGILRAAYGKAATMPAGGGTCDTCHSSTPVETLHHDAGDAVNGNCMSCHSSVNHSIFVADDSTALMGDNCSICHVGASGTATGIITDAADGLFHDVCFTCHQFNDTTNAGELRSAPGTKGVNVMQAGGATCTQCHTGEFHHNTGYAAVGQCEYCHTDPRPSAPDWDATSPGDNGSDSGLNVPTQLACLECHIDMNGSRVTVAGYARSDYTDYSTNWTTATIHDIPAAATSINNVGICFGCHDNSVTAGDETVRVWHARPDTNDSVNWALGTRDANRCREADNTAGYVAGRGSGDIAGFNLFFNDYEDLLGGSPYDPCNDYQQFNTTSLDYQRITVAAVSGNGSTGGSVPVFPSIVPNIYTGGTADVVNVSLAEWDGANLTVNATHIVQNGCANLTVAGHGTMGGTEPDCTLTVTTPYQATVNVTSANPDSVNVNGYPVADKSWNPGTLSFSSVSYSVDESGESVTVTVNRAEGSDGEVSVNYSTSDDTAIGGVDYTAVSGTLYWTDGEISSKTFTVLVHDDEEAESDETINLLLSGASGATLVNPVEAVLTIIDDDSPGTIVLNSDTYTVGETSGTATIVVSREGSKGAVSIDYASVDGGTAISGGTDYDTVSGTLSWADGDMADKSFTVNVYDDSVYNDDVTVNLEISNPLGGAFLGSPATAVLTIVDDELPPDQITSGKANWTAGSPSDGFDELENFEGLSGIVTNFGTEVTWTTGYSGGSTHWTVDSTTPSDGTGPQYGGNNGEGKFIFTEASTIDLIGADLTLTSSVLDAGSADYTLSFYYNMNVSGTPIVKVEIWDGSSWVVDTTVHSGEPVGDAWTYSGDIEISAYDNPDMQVRIVYAEHDDAYTNDFAIDDLRLIETIPSEPATLSILATNTIGDITSLHAEYNGNTYDLNYLGSNRWSFSGIDMADTYVNSITIWSDEDTAGKTYPVTESDDAPTWPSITIIDAVWDGVDSVDISAASDWNDQDQLFTAYDGSDPVAMIWNSMSNSWEYSFTGYPAFVAGDVTVSSYASTNSPQTSAVVDSTGN